MGREPFDVSYGINNSRRHLEEVLMQPETDDTPTFRFKTTQIVAGVLAWIVIGTLGYALWVLTSGAWELFARGIRWR